MEARGSSKSSFSAIEAYPTMTTSAVDFDTVLVRCCHLPVAIITAPCARPEPLTGVRRFPASFT